MATLQPYQSTLVKYHSSLVDEIRTDRVVPLLFVSHVLTQKEIDNIDIGRSWHERCEILLDVLHYKGERGFREFCNALEDTYPHLATQLRENKPQVEVLESESRQISKGESHIYSVSYKDKSRVERSGGEFEKRQELQRDAIISSRSQPESREMRRDQMSYDKRPYQSSAENIHRYGKYEERPQFNSTQMEHDRTSQGSSERGFRRSTTSLDVQPGPGEQEIWEKKTIVLEKAHANQSFGMAVSGGRGNPHKVTGDPSIVVSEIIPNSPAAGLLRPGDIICQVNDNNVENAMHGQAVTALKEAGNSARLVIKRRKIVPITKKGMSPKKDTQHMTLIRDKDKGYGFSLGHRLYIKEIDEKGVAANDGGIRPGDVLVMINDKRTDELTLRDAIDLVRKSKDQLDLVVLKQDKGGPSHFNTHSLPASYRRKEKPQELHNGYDEERAPDIPSRHYDEEDTRPIRPPPPDEEPEKGVPFSGSSWKRPGGLPSEQRDAYEKTNVEEPLQVLVPADVTLAAPVPEPWDRSLSVTKTTTTTVESWPNTPQSGMEGRKSAGMQYRDARLITFRKEGSLGIQVQGGNKVGIFVAAVREGSPAYEKGLREGDQILMANDIDLKDITREEAVLILLSLGEDVSLLVQHKKGAFEKISKEPGDDFYIKAHFSYEALKPEELSFEKESVFHVTDTMFNGVIGSWHAKIVDRVVNMERESGVIPNKCRAEQLAVVEQKKEEKTPQKMSTGSLRRSKRGSLRKDYKFRSNDKLDQMAFDDTERRIELPAYERVQRKRPDFVRPVALLGPIADITRDKLLQEMPDVYAVPGSYNYGGGSSSQKRMYTYRDIKEVIDSGRHCLLDISPEEVERLNYAQLYPIVIFIKPPSKQMVKEMRAQHGQSNKHIKQLYDNSVKLEQFFFDTFHAKISANIMDNWYGRVKEEISKQQQELVWMAEDKVEDEHDDMEFRAGRYSQAFDNESSHYDSALDSPTVRSSVSTQQVDEDIQVVDGSVVYSAPPEDNNFRQSYSEPFISYNGQDVSRHDDRGQDRYEYRYEKERDHYDDRPVYDAHDPIIEVASRPGYKPQGQPVSSDRKDQLTETAVQVLPSDEPRELRQSLRKSLPPMDSDELETEFDNNSRNLRRTEPFQRLNQPNELEEEVRNKRDALKKVEDDSSFLREIDERAGFKMSDVWTIENESRSRYDRREPSRRPDIEPSVSVSVKANTDDDLKARLEELDNIGQQQSRSHEPPRTKPKPRVYPSYERNVIIMNGSDNQHEVAQSTRYPTRSYVVGGQRSQSLDNERERDDVRVIRVGNPELSRPSEPPQKYLTQVTIPTRRDPKPERPWSGNLYAKPFNAPDFQLSRSQEDSSYPGKKRDEDRYRVVANQERLDNGRDDQHNVVTGDFESLDDDTQVVATARGRFTSKGGVLSSPESGVSIVIPEGAIPKGQEQEIYFKVCKDNNFMPPLDADKGETLLSPLVMCGPHGTKFLKPVELRLPHSASMTPDGWSFSIKSSDTPGDPHGNQTPQLRNLSLQEQDPKLDQCKVDSNSVSVLVDHF